MQHDGRDAIDNGGQQAGNEASAPAVAQSEQELG